MKFAERQNYFQKLCLTGIAMLLSRAYNINIFKEEVIRETMNKMNAFVGLPDTEPK